MHAGTKDIIYTNYTNHFICVCDMKDREAGAGPSAGRNTSFLESVFSDRITALKISGPSPQTLHLTNLVVSPFLNTLMSLCLNGDIFKIIES